MSTDQPTSQPTSQPTEASQPGMAAHAQKLLQLINAQIDFIVTAFTTPVIAVSNALSMQIDEVTSAYSGKCPDQSSDVEPLDLDTGYVTIIDALRRTRPEAYRMLADAAKEWHDTTPVLYEQPMKMAALSLLLVENMPDNRATKQCLPAVSSAVTASLSSTPPQPHTQSDLAESDVDQAE